MSAQQTTFSATCSRLRGIRLTISLPKTGYYLGEKIRMDVTVENRSFLDFAQITVRPVEMMRWRGYQEWVPVTLTPIERAERAALLLRRSSARGRKTGPWSKFAAAREAAQADEPTATNAATAMRVDEERGEHVFGVAMRRGTTVRCVLELTVDERHLNGSPYGMAHAVMLEHQYALQVKLRRTGIGAGLVEPTVATGPIVFDHPAIEAPPHGRRA